MRETDGGMHLLVTARQAAELLNVSERTVWALLATGELVSIRVGRWRLVPRKALERFVAVRTEKASVQTGKGQNMAQQNGSLGDTLPGQEVADQ